MTNKENALKVIRYIQDTVEGLKELREGLLVKSDNGVLYKVLEQVQETAMGGTWVLWEIGTGNGTGEQGDIIFSDYEIIGHQVQLNHLLLAITKNENIIVDTSIGGKLVLMNVLDGLSGGKEVTIMYDLTKTVQENLESNEALCQYLLDLFQLTTNN